MSKIEEWNQRIQVKYLHKETNEERRDTLGSKELAIRYAQLLDDVGHSMLSVTDLQAGEELDWRSH